MIEPAEPSWRKPVGALGIVALIVVWCAVVVSLSGTVNRWPTVLMVLFYLGTGIVWIAPLRPLLLWMETGRWR